MQVERMRVKNIEIGATYWVGVPEGVPSRLYGSPGSRRGAELRRLCGRRFELTVIRVETSARPYPMVEGMSTVEMPLVAVRVSAGELAVSGRIDEPVPAAHTGGLGDQDGRSLTIHGKVRIRVPARWLRSESRSAS